ncbi:MAG: sigma-70 family RNA polymerase sigma factor [Gemmataceae bacterium]|nr:sigma-70 family RNA polymerase sigma factor [Gemmataceae bacterium]
MPSVVQRTVESLRVRSLPKASARCSDRQLLEAFAVQGDESAFAELVRRHGPLVLGVCRRVLGNVQDAEDALQAAFLVLARKSATLRPRDSINHWLHGVAFRIALKARSQSWRRKQKEKQAVAQRTATTPQEAWNELRAALDEELERLPAKYRTVLLLCCLQGKTRDEAAQELGWSLGSVKGCLERGRELLHKRLTKRGLTLAAALSVDLCSASPILAAALAARTVQAALRFAAVPGAHAALAEPILQLAQGALNAMMIAKIKTMAMALFLLCLGFGAIWMVHDSCVGRPASASAATILTAPFSLDPCEGAQGLEPPGRVQNAPAQGPDQGILWLRTDPDSDEKPPRRSFISNAPEAHVRGMVIRIDAEKNLAEIDRGADHGLEIGHTLEVFRLQPRPEYLGVMKILQVMPQRAVGSMIKLPSKKPLEIGDSVASRIEREAEKPKDKNLLEAQRDRTKIEEQRMSNIVEARLRKARLTYPDDAQEALKLLRTTLLQIWDHPDISERHRETLLAQIVAARRELTKVE